MIEIIITQTVSPKCYCKYENTMCEFANDRGYCVKTGCSKRITINEKPFVNKNLVEVVRCKDCKHLAHSWVSSDMNNNMIFHCNSLNQFVADDFFCADGERRSE